MRSLIIFMAAVFLALGTIGAGATTAPATATYDRSHGGYELCVMSDSSSTGNIDVLQFNLPSSPTSVTAPTGWTAGSTTNTFAFWTTTFNGIAPGTQRCGFLFKLHGKLSGPQTVLATFCSSTSCGQAQLTATEIK